MNIVTLLEMAADAFPDRVGFTCGDQRLTYAELLAASRAAGGLFRKEGGAFAIFLDVSGPAAPIALYGAGYAGIPYVPLNYRLTKPELDALLARVAPGALIAAPEYSAPLDIPEDIETITAESFRAALIPGEGVTGEAPDDPRAIAVQLFTSGTTGKPKAAILRHENLLSYILESLEFGSAEEDDAILVTVPPYHIAGISAVLSATYSARRMVMLPNFDPESWIRLAQTERVSNAFLVPTMLSRLIDYASEKGKPLDLPHLRALAYGGGKMPFSTIARAMELLPHVDFTNAYGLTETSSTICLLGPDDHRDAAASADPAIKKRLASVGKPLPAIELEIRDEGGVVLPLGEPGLVFVRGGQVSGEYHEIGSALDTSGWFSTRDRGYLDEGGYLFLDGRADDVIVRGGENISPGEIEEVLLTHSAVADAAVVAMPDEEWGEAVAAAVVLKHGAKTSEAELQQWVRERLRSTRVPKAVRFRGELPYNDLGKVLRRVIRQEFQEES
jgi:acyl-CoA synthetase (AMP-forming)/AMP-acid ligase II